MLTLFYDNTKVVGFPRNTNIGHTKDAFSTFSRRSCARCSAPIRTSSDLLISAARWVSTRRWWAAFLSRCQKFGSSGVSMNSSADNCAGVQNYPLRARGHTPDILMQHGTAECMVFRASNVLRPHVALSLGISRCVVLVNGELVTAPAVEIWKAGSQPKQ